MKFISILASFIFITLIFTSNIYGQDKCLKGCEKLPPQKQEKCYYEQEDCYDQQRVNQILKIEKQGVTSKYKIQIKNELRREIKALNKHIARNQLRRAMFKKLLKKAEKFIIIQDD